MSDFDDAADRVTFCSVCGGTVFAANRIIWDGLANEWQLAPHERAYMDRQQGTHCVSCGANLRSLALANAVRAAIGTHSTLMEFVQTPAAARLAILEINEAGSLHPALRQVPGHVFAVYPAVNMHALPYEADTFDLVVHSDTLEHVTDPIHALVECRRVLRQGGTLCFTVPTIVERLSRSREGMPKSYHGDPVLALDDYVVRTEFGADMWSFVMRAGFEAVRINTVAYPAGLALSAQKGLAT